MASTNRVVLRARLANHAFRPPLLLNQCFSTRRSLNTLSSRSRLTHGQQRFQSYVPGNLDYQPPRQRSLTFRVVRGFLTLTAGGLIAAFAGLAVGFYFLPSDIQRALRHGPPSDAETLTLYNPLDPDEAEIDQNLRNHPLAVTLRQNPAFTESRPHMKIPQTLRPTNLTGGTLAGPGKIVVPPIVFVEEGGKSLVSLFYLGEMLCGHPDIVHGGLLATMLDEGLARCCFPALPGKIGVTANLQINYRAPARSGKAYVLKADTILVEGRKARVKGRIEALDGSDKGRTVCEAEALFVAPKGVKATMLDKLVTAHDREKSEKSK